MAADNKKDYENALSLYQKGVDHFSTGLKYEKNPKSKKAIEDKVAEYMVARFCLSLLAAVLNTFCFLEPCGRVTEVPE